MYEQKRAGEVGWLSEFRSSCTSSGLTPPYSCNQMDESEYRLHNKRPACVPFKGSKGGFVPVSQQELFGDPGPIRPARHYAGFDDGRIRLRLEWGSSSVPSQWCLVAMGTFQLNQLEGVERNFGFSHSLQEFSSRTLHQSPFRQQGGFVLHLQSGLFTHSSIIRPFQRIIAICSNRIFLWSLFTSRVH